MLKNILVLAIFLILVANVFADISVVSDTAKITYKKDEVHELGIAQKGETVSVNVASDPNYAEIQAEWSQLQVVPESLPAGWSYENSPENKKVLQAKIAISKDARPAEYYEFKVRATNSQNLLESETLRVRVKVDKGLLKTDLPETVKTVKQGQKNEFKLTLINNSISSHTVSVDSDLPETWFKKQEFTVQPGEKKEVVLQVTPQVYGNHKFAFKINSTTSNELLDLINIKLTVEPTLKNKYSAAFEGFPFFSISLLPYYLFNSFLSLLLQ